MGIVTLEPQHDFPREDISDSNADMLELLLLNGEMVELSHLSAEKVSYLYQIGHKGLVIAAASHIDDQARQRAFSYGITTFEAVAALVRPDIDISAHNDAIRINPEVLGAQQHLEYKFLDTVDKVRDSFAADLPRTRSLVGQSAARFCRDYPDYAITGAAVARWLELDATAA